MGSNLKDIFDLTDGISDEKRFRSPNWHLHERELLLDLVKEHYHVIESKKLDGGTHKRKHKEWAIMARKFNARNSVSGPRTGKELRGQWANLRKSAKRDEQTRLDTGDGPYTKNPLHDRIVALMQTKINETTLDIDNIQDEDSGDVPLASSNKESNEIFDTCAFETKVEIRPWDDANDNSDEEHETEIKEDVPIVRREIQFTARDCRLLLHCVRQEKGAIFGGTSSAKKHSAWVRVSRFFNRQSPSKRQPSELKKKFQSLQCMATKINCAKKILGPATKRRTRYEELNDDTENGVEKKIKSEPKSDVTDDADDDSDCGSQDVSVHSRNDPLSNGVSVDSGLSFTNHSGNNSVEKLRIELLTYEMETAKLQRKRVEDAIAAEKLEASLRLRSARLEVQAAETKLSPSHPALAYTAAEVLAQQYMAYSVP